MYSVSWAMNVILHIILHHIECGDKNRYMYKCGHTVYPKKYAHGFVVLCFVVVVQSFIMNSHEVFIHIHQGCFAGTGAIVRLPQRQWSKPDGYGKISQCITTTKHSKGKTVWIFLGIYCMSNVSWGMACYIKFASICEWYSRGYPILYISYLIALYT